MKCGLCSLLAWILLAAFVAGVLGYLSGEPRDDVPSNSLADSRCIANGDWRDTPYCKAVAQEPSGV